MCGLFGGITLRNVGFSLVCSEVLSTLAIASQVRGVNGYGMVYEDVRKNKEPVVCYVKAPCSLTQEWSSLSLKVKIGETSWMIGHTRSSTIGEDTLENTHPFIFDSVMGVHNGTVHGWKGYIEGLPEDGSITTDSMAIMFALNQAPPEDASKVLAKLVVGAYALVWYDSRIKSIRIARNSQRPLFLARVEDSWIWASEKGMILWATERANTTLVKGPEMIGNERLITIPLEDGSVCTVEPYVTDRPSVEDYYADVDDACWLGNGWNRFKSYLNPITHDTGPLVSSFNVESPADIWASSDEFRPFRLDFSKGIRTLLGLKYLKSSSDISKALMELAEGGLYMTVLNINSASTMAYGVVGLKGGKFVPATCPLAADDRAALIECFQKGWDEFEDPARHSAVAQQYLCKEFWERDQLPIIGLDYRNLILYPGGEIGIGGEVDQIVGTTSNEEVIQGNMYMVGSEHTHPAILYHNSSDWAWSDGWDVEASQ